MHHTAALVASLASLGLICAIYYCNILSQPGSWLRNDALAMIFLSLLTGLFPLGLTAGLVGLWISLSNGINMTSLMSAGVDLGSLAAIFAAVVVFRALVRATYRTPRIPSSITPIPPRPTAPQSYGSSSRKAA